MTAKKTPAKAVKKVPASAPRPQDHKARKAEADGVETVLIEQCGVEMELPANNRDMPLEVAEMFAEGNHVLAIRALVGPDAWAQMKAAGATGRDLDELGDKYNEALGLAQGE